MEQKRLSEIEKIELLRLSEKYPLFNKQIIEEIQNKVFDNVPNTKKKKAKCYRCALPLIERACYRCSFSLAGLFKRKEGEPICEICNFSGHLMRNCLDYQLISKDFQLITCLYCRKQGHSNCYDLKNADI